MPFVKLFQSAEATLNSTIYYYVQPDGDQVEIIGDSQSSTTLFTNNTNKSRSSTNVCNNNVDQQDFITEAIGIIEQMEAVAQATDKRIREAIEVLETELSLTKLPAVALLQERFIE
jgi:hypothetical protein